MTGELESLRSLQKRIREATEPDRELDGDIIVALKGGEIIWKTANYTMDQYPAHRYQSKHHLGGFANEHVPFLTASIDACVALMREVLPGALWSVWDMEEGAGCRLLCPGKGGGYHDGAQISTDPHDWAPPTVCLAFLDAIVSGKIAEEEAKDNDDGD